MSWSLCRAVAVSAVVCSIQTTNLFADDPPSSGFNRTRPVTEIPQPPATGNATQRPVVGSTLPDAGSVAIYQDPLGGHQFTLGNRTINLAGRSFRPAYQAHPRYYVGSWNSQFGAGAGISSATGTSGRSGIVYRPLGWGLGTWGLGTLAYQSGYLSYDNPYYGAVAYDGGYDYARPVLISYEETPTSSGKTDPASSDSILATAIEAFRQNDVNLALDLVNQGVSRFPNDSVLHEFRALVLFAKGNYQQAASTIHAVLAIGPGWNWETMYNIYRNVDVYTAHLRALEAANRKDPGDAASRFLLAYHYLVAGHAEAAARKLADVVRLMPQDGVAADLLKLAASVAPSRATAAAETVILPAATHAALKVDPAMLMGIWTATRDDGSKFTLRLEPNGSFNWKLTRKDVNHEFAGKYSIHDNVVALERTDGGSLVATVTPDGQQKFNFKLLGAPPEDPGLNFQQ